jgi:hypothetical protein
MTDSNENNDNIENILTNFKLNFNSDRVIDKAICVYLENCKLKYGRTYTDTIKSALLSSIYLNDPQLHESVLCDIVEYVKRYYKLEHDKFLSNILMKAYTI